MKKLSDCGFPMLQKLANLRGRLSMLAAFVFSVLVIQALVQLHCPPALTLAFKLIAGLWTIAVPSFLFAEYVVRGKEYRDEANKSGDFEKANAERRAKLRELKDMQDQARAVWLACAPILGFLYWK